MPGSRRLRPVVFQLLITSERLRPAGFYKPPPCGVLSFEPDFFPQFGAPAIFWRNRGEGWHCDSSFSARCSSDGPMHRQPARSRGRRQRRLVHDRLGRQFTLLLRLVAGMPRGSGKRQSRLLQCESLRLAGGRDIITASGEPEEAVVEHAAAIKPRRRISAPRGFRLAAPRARAQRSRDRPWRAAHPVRSRRPACRRQNFHGSPYRAALRRETAR